MNALFLMLGLMAGGGAAWWLVQFAEEEKYTSRLREIESKFRFSQGEILNLKEQLIAVRAQVAAAEKTVVEERATHTMALSAMAASFKKGILALATAYCAAGLVVGGVSGWFGAGWKFGARGISEKSQLEMTARLAELKVDLLQKQLEQVSQSSNFFEKACGLILTKPVRFY